MSNICVKAENLSKRFFVFKMKETSLRVLKALLRRESIKRELWVLRDISFEIRKGEKWAIVGKNGSGKTTLLRILTGIYDKTSGYIKVEGEPNTLFGFQTGFMQDLSVIDNIYLCGVIYKMGRNFLKHRVNKILETAELYHLRFSALKKLSMGQVQRLALTIFFQSASDFLVFDESLGFIDRGFARKCEAHFKELFSSDKTVIITSHNTSFLKRYSKMAIWIDKGRIRMQGDVNNVIGEYERFCGNNGAADG